MKRRIFSSLLIVLLSFAAGITTTSAYAQITVTDLYEVGQGNVAMTSHSTYIRNQYIYSPYGSQKKLNHPVTLNGSANNSDQALINATRRPLNLQHNQFGYTGQSSDPSTSLMMLGGFRNYAPGIGRFIQPDTYNSFSQVSINNTFTYVNNNPLANNDPSGHFAAVSDFFSVLGVIGGFAGKEVSGGVALAAISFGFDAFSGGSNIIGNALGGSFAQGFNYFSDAAALVASGLGMNEARIALSGGASIAAKVGLSFDALGLGSSAMSIAGTVTHHQTLSQVGDDLGDVAIGAGLLTDGIASRIAAERMKNGLNAGSEALGELAANAQQSYLDNINGRINRTFNASEPVGRYSIQEAQKEAFASIVGESMDLHMMLHEQMNNSIMDMHAAFLSQMRDEFAAGAGEVEGIEADREHYVVNQAFIGAQQIDHPNINIDGMHGMSLFSNGLRDELTPRDYYMIHAVAGAEGDPRDYYMMLRDAVDRYHPNFWGRYAVSGRRNNGLE